MPILRHAKTVTAKRQPTIDLNIVFSFLLATSGEIPAKRRERRKRAVLADWSELYWYIPSPVGPVRVSQEFMKVCK